MTTRVIGTTLLDSTKTEEYKAFVATIKESDPDVKMIPAEIWNAAINLGYSMGRVAAAKEQAVVDENKEKNKQARRLVHIVAGSNIWTPTTGDLTNLSQMFASAVASGADSVVVTRDSVSVSQHWIAGDSVFVPVLAAGTNPITNSESNPE